MAHMRVAVISYEHVKLEWSESGMTIGQQVDAHLSEVIMRGDSVSEVSLFFETPEEQARLSNAYAPSHSVEAEPYVERKTKAR